MDDVDVLSLPNAVFRRHTSSLCEQETCYAFLAIQQFCGGRWHEALLMCLDGHTMENRPHIQLPEETRTGIESLLGILGKSTARGLYFFGSVERIVTANP